MTAHKTQTQSTVLRLGPLAAVAIVTFALFGGRAGALSDNDPRALALGQSYTALARGPQAVFWNPANLALSDGSKFQWDLLGAGVTLIAQNNSFSVQTYNDHFTDADHEIRGSVKDDLLGDIPSEGLKFNLDIIPNRLIPGVPLNGGVAFPLPGGIRSAITTSFVIGLEGEMPKDMFELMLFGNEFDRQYDIAKWDGSGWVLGGLNFAGAKQMMPGQLKPYLSEFTVGATLKVLGGGYGEIMDSDGGFISQIQGTNMEAFATFQQGGGFGFGLDLGVAGVTKDRKTTFSVGMLNLLDTFSWSIKAEQDSVFAKASDLRLTRFVDPAQRQIEEIFENEDIDGDGNVDFRKVLSENSFSRSIPAMLRLGVAHQPTAIPRMTVVGNYDQAFSDGFGISSSPRLSAGAEYRLVPWFPTRIGLSIGGRSGSSMGLGLAFGPFSVYHMQLELLDFAYVTRGGFLPGVAKGSALSLMFFRFNLI